MHHSATRRLFATLLGIAWLPTAVLSAQRNFSTKRWLLGDWESDQEKTMENFYFQGQSLTIEQREKIAALFGHLRYHITSKQFEVIQPEGKLRTEYVVVSETESTITLRFQRTRDMPDLTLYRVSDDLLFIKSGKNLEYFRRTAA